MKTLSLFLVLLLMPIGTTLAQWTPPGKRVVFLKHPTALRRDYEPLNQTSRRLPGLRQHIQAACQVVAHGNGEKNGKKYETGERKYPNYLVTVFDVHEK